MLYEVPSFRASRARRFAIDDLTVIIGVRAHDKNPWVKQRLEHLGRYWKPRGRIIVVDFGSPERHREDLARIGKAVDLDIVREDDCGVFCAARARNIGAQQATTDLLFFTDVDCVGQTDLLQQLVDQANLIELGTCFDQMVNLPVYHLTSTASSGFSSLENAVEASMYLSRIFAQSTYGSRRDACEYIDPFSNFFVCHRSFFDWVGGFNENFRGHGSEDYEFQLRFFQHSGQFPMPTSPHEDLYGVRSDGFFGTKTYRGFRRLGEVISLQSQLSGLRLAHLYHERSRETDDWYRSRDKARTRFDAQVLPFLNAPQVLLRYDWMPRNKRAIALLSSNTNYRLVMPLRLAGYRIEPVTLGNTTEETWTLSQIDQRQVDAIIMVEPSGEANDHFLEFARQRAVEPIVIRRGLLPESYHFAIEDAPRQLLELDGFDETALTASELQVAAEYVATMKDSSVTSSSSQQPTRFATLAHEPSHTCWVHINGSELPLGFDEVIRSYPNVQFFLFTDSKDLAGVADNLVVYTNDNDTKNILPLVDAVIVDEPSDALLGMLFGKLVIVVGQTRFFPGYIRHATTFGEALHVLYRSDQAFIPQEPITLLAWLLGRSYSFSRDNTTYQFRFNDTHFRKLRARLSVPFDTASYASGLLGVTVLGTGSSPDRRYSTSPRRRKWHKFRHKPLRFFADSSQTWFRWLTKLWK